jgi:hypothetical protein
MRYPPAEKLEIIRRGSLLNQAVSCLKIPDDGHPTNASALILMSSIMALSAFQARTNRSTLRGSGKLPPGRL